MAGYIESTLVPGEHIVFRGNRSPWSYLVKLLVGGGLAMVNWVGVAIGVTILVSVLVDYATTEMAITNKRVVSKSGLIARKTVEISIRKVESIQVDQGILGRLLGYGTLAISGAGVAQASLKSVASPVEFRAAALRQAEYLPATT